MRIFERIVRHLFSWINKIDPAQADPGARTNISDHIESRIDFAQKIEAQLQRDRP